MGSGDMGVRGVRRGTRRLGGYLETGWANPYSSFFPISSQVPFTATYGLVPIASAVVARRPLLLHCGALLAVHAVSSSDLRHASRFSGSPYYSISPFEWYTPCHDSCSPCREIWIFVRRGVLGRFCRYLEKECADWVGCFFYVLPTFPSTVLRGFVSIAPAVIIRASSPSPHPCCAVMSHTVYLPQF
ncbi:hypothetical protein EDD15DRAFT_1825115 [Pisolithus albus]|nr:hypothetical protein EDD15DRAFT_1825115 [Pisolithus albus]